MLPAASLSLSLTRTSVRDVHDAPCGKKNAAASSAISQCCLNRTGQVTAMLLPLNTLQTPSGLSALSFVQFGTLLLKGQSRDLR